MVVWDKKGGGGREKGEGGEAGLARLAVLANPELGQLSGSLGLPCWEPLLSQLVNIPHIVPSLGIPRHKREWELWGTPREFKGLLEPGLWESREGLGTIG